MGRKDDPEVNVQLARLGRAEARRRVAEVLKTGTQALGGSGCQPCKYPGFESLDAEALARQVEALTESIVGHCLLLTGVVQEQSRACVGLTEEAAAMVLERRQRDEDTARSSFVLKYLLDSNSTLRRRLQEADNGVGVETPAGPRASKPSNRRETTAVSPVTLEDREGEEARPREVATAWSHESTGRQVDERRVLGSSNQAEKHNAVEARQAGPPRTQPARQSAQNTTLPVGTKDLDRVIQKVSMMRKRRPIPKA